MDNNLSQKRKDAFNHILQVVSSKLGKISMYSVAALGIASFYPGIELPPAIAIIGGSIGIEAIGSILDRVTNNNDISDAEIINLIHQVLHNSQGNQTLTKEHFSDFIDFLVKRLSAQDNREKQILELLAEIKISIDGKSADIPSHSLFDRLDQMQASLDDLQTKIPDPIQKITNVKHKELGKSAIIHLENATQISMELTSATKDFSDGLEKSRQKVDKFLLSKKYSKKSLNKLVSYLTIVISKYAIALENKSPEFAHAHKLAIESYIKDATYWFNSDIPSVTAVSSMFQTLSRTYKPQLTASTNVSNFIVENQKPMLDSLIPNVSKSYSRNYKKAEARLFKIQRFHKYIRLMALEHVNQAEQVLKSMSDYLEFKQNHKF